MRRCARCLSSAAIYDWASKTFLCVSYADSARRKVGSLVYPATSLGVLEEPEPGESEAAA